jgi:hypothetical protein
MGHDLYDTARHIQWAVTAFMGMVIGVALDSIARDFVLLGCLIVIGLLAEFRDYLVQYRSESSRTR